MPDFSSLFSGTIDLIDMLKPSTLEKLGPSGNAIKLMAQTVAAVLAALVVVFGPSQWAPPTPTMPNLPLRGLIAIMALGFLTILFVSGKATGTVDLWFWCFVVFAAGLVFMVIYFVLKRSLCFSCEDDEEVHVAGFWRHKQARFVLRGEADKLKKPYVLNKGADGQLEIPANSKDYFCRAHAAPDFVWREWSVTVASAILVIFFWLAMAPLPLALFGAATALTQPDLKQDNRSITLPADVLFAFGSDQIRTMAAESLASAAEIIRTKKISRARIEGHSDGKARDPNYNRALSLQRATAVKAWLIDKEGLGKVAFDTVGYGPDRPVAAEIRDGKDDPHAREQNRRVEIQLVQ